MAPKLGVNYSYLSKLENDKAMPSARFIKRVARYFGCDEDSLYVAADKVPPDAMEAIKQRPTEAMRYLRSLRRVEYRKRRGSVRPAD